VAIHEDTTDVDCFVATRLSAMPAHAGQAGKDDEGRCCVTLTCKDENAAEVELAIRKLNSNQNWNHHW